MLELFTPLIFSMIALQGLLGVSLLALIILDVNGVPVKGAPSQHLSNSDPGYHFASHKSAASSRSSPASFRVPAGASKHHSQPQFMAVESMPEAGYATGTVPVGIYSASFMPAYDAGAQQAGAPQSSLPEAKWVMAPQAFDETPTGTQGHESSAFLPPPVPPAPSLQSGETANVVKEAELGNYQQQTEEFGYPSSPMGPGQGFPLVSTQSLGVGGMLRFSPYPLTYPFPYPYPEFDYRLLYGLYPPGTYSTFSRDHEKGTDYFQDIHYLKEHGSDVPQTPQNPGSGQQKVLPGML